MRQIQMRLQQALINFLQKTLDIICTLETLRVSHFLIGDEWTRLKQISHCSKKPVGHLSTDNF
jgi:hypothetical protein